jgi:hypothetical protein
MTQNGGFFFDPNRRQVVAVITFHTETSAAACSTDLQKSPIIAHRKIVNSIAAYFLEVVP